jgi:hypothetical protein
MIHAHTYRYRTYAFYKHVVLHCMYLHVFVCICMYFCMYQKYIWCISVCICMYCMYLVHIARLTLFAAANTYNTYNTATICTGYIQDKTSIHTIHTHMHCEFVLCGKYVYVSDCIVFVSDGSYIQHTNIYIPNTEMYVLKMYCLYLHVCISMCINAASNE